VNRIDPTLNETAAARRLPDETLAHWSPVLFAHALDCARTPVAVTGGLASTRLSYGPRLVERADGVAAVDARIVAPDDPTVHHSARLFLTAETLDRLVHLLAPRALGGNRSSCGLGSGLSADALEALLCALFAPLGSFSIGRAGWIEEARDGLVLAIHGNGLEIVVDAAADAHQALLALFRSRSDRPVAAPLTYLRAPIGERLSVGAEEVVGLAHIGEAEAASLDAGWGIVPDILFDTPKTLLAGRFLHEGGVWRSLDAMGNWGEVATIGFGSDDLMIDMPIPAPPSPQRPGLTLKRAGQFLGTGQWVVLGGDADQRPRIAFEITARPQRPGR
jgi:hypothetical protein